ncbi:branched-chain amino acid ABC transporter permease [Sphaerimonospora mesophila]|uniref:branched-chain amino acid ABC transporter permease n=1 Tax=Sphaerimonospora mesophila TaxID=37483 RepID=UPI0006E26974
MTYLAQQIVNGLSIGLIYAGLALALVLVFHGSGILNIAQGQFATFSAFLAWTLTTYGVPWPLIVIGVVVVSFVLGAAVERVLIRPIEGAHELNLLVATLALLLLLNATIGSLWGYLPQSVPSPFGEGVVRMGDVVITAHQLGAVAVLGGSLVLMAALFRYTTVGLRMRAATENPESARLLGVSVSRMLLIGWGLAAAMGAIVGMLAAPMLGLDTTIFFNAMLYAFAAVTLGGLTSMAGSVVGGLVLGLAQTLSAAYIPAIGSDLNVVVPFVLILAVLLVRPSGLFGRATSGRV